MFSGNVTKPVQEKKPWSQHNLDPVHFPTALSQRFLTQISRPITELRVGFLARLFGTLSFLHWKGFEEEEHITGLLHAGLSGVVVGAAHGAALLRIFNICHALPFRLHGSLQHRYYIYLFLSFLDNARPGTN